LTRSNPGSTPHGDAQVDKTQKPPVFPLPRTPEPKAETQNPRAAAQGYRRLRFSSFHPTCQTAKPNPQTKPKPADYPSIKAGYPPATAKSDEPRHRRRQRAACLPMGAVYGTRTPLSTPRFPVETETICVLTPHIERRTTGGNTACDPPIFSARSSVAPIAARRLPNFGDAGLPGEDLGATGFLRCRLARRAISSVSNPMSTPLRRSLWRGDAVLPQGTPRAPASSASPGAATGDRQPQQRRAFPAARGGGAFPQPRSPPRARSATLAPQSEPTIRPGR